MGSYKGRVGRGPLYGIHRKTNNTIFHQQKTIFLYAIYYRLLKILYAINTFLICHKQENKETYMT